MAGNWTSITSRSEALPRGQQSMVHGVLWFAVISVTAFLFTGRTGIEALSVGGISGIMYAGVVYVWNPY